MKNFQDILNAFRNVPQMRYNVHTQDDGDTAVIDIDGYIGRNIIQEWLTGEKSPNTATEIKKKLRSITASKIIVNINSPGGDLNEGLVIRNILMSKKAEVVTNLMGFSASAATVIHQAGDKRRMPEESAFMLIHRCMYGLCGYYNQNSFRAYVEDLEIIDETLVGMFVQASTLSTAEVVDIMDAGEGYGRWMSGEEALEHGLVDELYDPGDTEDPDTDHLEGEEDPENRRQMAENLLSMPPANSFDPELFNETAREGKKEPTTAQKDARSRSATRKREIEIYKLKGA